MISTDAKPLERLEYPHANRLNYVLNFAHINWASDLNLDLLASIACLSKYHFTKLFHDYTGEPPIGFIKRIRLENSASMLSYRRELTISDIALSSGFSSNQTFSRAFTNKFGNSPREFRALYAENLESALQYPKANRYAKSSTISDRESDLSKNKAGIKLEYRPPIKVAYFRNIGSYGISDGIDQAIWSIRQWAKVNGFWNDKTRVIGASWDSNCITPNTLCKYDACIQVPDNYPLKSEISVQVLPGGPYVVFHAPYKKSGEISLIWRYFTTLLRQSPKFANHRIRSKPCFEIFEKNQLDEKPEVALYLQLIR